MRSVKAKELPELDDEFASTASEFDTLDELREDVRTRLGRVKVMQQGSQARDKLVEHLLEVIEVPVPETLVERELEWRTRSMEGELQQAGMDWDAYFEMAGIEGREAYEADMRTNVENAVRTQFVLDAIADAREVTVDNDDLSAQIMAQAQRNRMSPEQYAQQLQQGNNIADFVADVRRTKALAQLLESTTITDASGNESSTSRPCARGRPPAGADGDEAEPRRRRPPPRRPRPRRPRRRRRRQGRREPTTPTTRRRAAAEEPRRRRPPPRRPRPRRLRRRRPRPRPRTPTSPDRRLTAGPGRPPTAPRWGGRRRSRGARACAPSANTGRRGSGLSDVRVRVDVTPRRAPPAPGATRPRRPTSSTAPPPRDRLLDSPTEVTAHVSTTHPTAP